MASKIREDAVWITWERQTRNRSASDYFNVPLYEIIEDGSSRALRYFISIIKTVSIITRKKPRYFFAQNPSIILAVLAVSLKRLATVKVIIDAHNAGIHGPENSGRILPAINRFVIRKADAVIVTNSELAAYVATCGGNPIVLPDPLPNLALIEHANGASPEPQRKLTALCITSWSDDEPYQEILDAASAFPEEVEFLFSGNYKKVWHTLPDTIPENVNLLGFVDEDTFHRHLFSADFCIDMTKRSDCMVCGAYESISAEKPIILSDTPVQRRYFSKGALFSQNSTAAITNAIYEMINNLESNRQDASDLKKDILARESSQKALILSQIRQL